MSSASESKTKSILTILAELSARRVTGILRFEPGQASSQNIEFLFRKGRLLYATSNIPGERLGEFLVRQGVLTADQVSSALTEAKRKERYLQLHLVEEGLVEQQHLGELMYARTEELLDIILHADEGQFLFHPDLPDEHSEANTPWVDEEMFSRLLAHKNVWPQTYDKLRDPGLILRCHRGIKGSVAFHSLSAGEQKLLALLDGIRPISNILAGRKNRVDIMIVLSRFLESGLIEIVEQQPQAPSAAAAFDLDEPESFSASLLFKEVEAASSVKPAQPASEPRVSEASDEETIELLEQFEEDLLDKAPALVDKQVRPPQAPQPPPMPVQASPSPKVAEPAPKVAAAPQQTQAPAQKPAAPAPAPVEEKPLNPNVVPIFPEGMRLSDMSVTGLMMDDLYLISRIDGKSSIKQLSMLAQLPEKDVARVVQRLLNRGYLSLQQLSQPEPPPKKPDQPPKPASDPRITVEVLGPGAIPSTPAVETKSPTAVRSESVPPSSSPTPTKPAPSSIPQNLSPKEEAQEVYKKGVGALNQGEFFYAEDMFKAALRLHANFPLYQARLAIAMLARAEGLEQADKLAEAALDEDPLNGACFEALALVRVRMGDLNEARRYLEKASMLDRKRVPAAPAIINVLKGYKLPKGATPEHLWSDIKPILRFAL